MTDRMGERGRQGATPLGGRTDIETVRSTLEQLTHFLEYPEDLNKTISSILYEADGAFDALSRIERLIAATPELLEALEAMLTALRSFVTESVRDPSKGPAWEVAARQLIDTAEPANAALAKARGEQ